MFKNKNILITGVGKGIGKELMIECIKIIILYTAFADPDLIIKIY